MARNPLIIRKRTLPPGVTSHYGGRPLGSFGTAGPNSIDPTDPNNFWSPTNGSTSGAAPIDPNAAPGMGGIGGNYRAAGGQYRADPNADLRTRLGQLGTQEWFAQTGIEEQQGDSYALNPQDSLSARTPLDPGFDTPSFVNPYRTVMYSVAGLSTTQPQRIITGNFKRTYLLVQNLGPGNLFLGIGTDPNSGGVNVLNLVSTQVYEQIGGGFYLPPNPWYPQGLAICSSFVSPEYISLLTDTVNTAAMILEGTFSPPRVGSHPS
jgi:hypothetical protein